MPYAERVAIVKSLKFVDLVIPETCWAQKAIDIKKHNVSILVMGDDWLNKFDYLRERCTVIYLPRTKEISSSLLREILN